jgi:hypothetical protein
MKMLSRWQVGNHLYSHAMTNDITADENSLC